MPATSPEAKRRRNRQIDEKRRQRSRLLVRECRRCGEPFRRADPQTTMHFCSTTCRWTRPGEPNPVDRFLARIFDASARQLVLSLPRDPCAYCGVIGGEKDHITPPPPGFGRSRPHRFAGSSGEWENLNGACGRCNWAKGRQSLLEFLNWPAGWLR